MSRERGQDPRMCVASAGALLARQRLAAQRLWRKSCPHLVRARARPHSPLVREAEILGENAGSSRLVHECACVLHTHCDSQGWQELEACAGLAGSKRRARYILARCKPVVMLMQAECKGEIKASQGWFCCNKYSPQATSRRPADAATATLSLIH